MANNIFEQNLYNSEWMGEIVDNKDPEFRGRCKIKIFGIFSFEEESDEIYKKNNIKNTYR